MKLAPLYLLDTCTVINLTYSQPITNFFESSFRTFLGWVEVVHTELDNKANTRPPLPNAPLALQWGISNLGTPIQVQDGNVDFDSIFTIRASIAGTSVLAPFAHLGEAASIYHLTVRGGGALISDDHDARFEAKERGVKSVSSVGLVSRALMGGVPLTDKDVDCYLNSLRAAGRMKSNLSAADLRAGKLKSWA